MVDDNPRVLRALEPPLRRRGFSLVSACSYDEARILIDEFSDPPEAAIFDICLGRAGTGIDLARRLRARFSMESSIMVLSGISANDIDIKSGLCEINATFASKPLATAVLDDFLLTACVTRYLPNSVLQGTVRSIAEHHVLSIQQIRVVAMLAKGILRSELANALNVTRNTLKWQVRHLLVKLGLDSTEQVVSLVLRTLATSEEASACAGNPPCSGSPDETNRSNLA